MRSARSELAEQKRLNDAREAAFSLHFHPNGQIPA
jgi:hypothetical protein